MKIGVFGRGWIGTRLAKDLGAVLFDTDIADPAAVAAVLRAERPDAVINAAGKTGRPNVDWCETHREETWRANVVGVVVLAEACAEAGVHLVHLSSGCIFYGASPAPGGWREGDMPNPISLYARSKMTAEYALFRFPDVAVVRPRMPIDTAPHPRNLLTKLANYPNVVDAENSVTVVSDFVEVVRRLVEVRARGFFHATNPGSVTHRQILGWYRRYVDPSHSCTWMSAEELLAHGHIVRQRSECVLASSRLEALGIHMPPAEAAVEAVVRRYGRG